MTSACVVAARVLFVVVSVESASILCHSTRKKLFVNAVSTPMEDEEGRWRKVRSLKLFGCSKPRYISIFLQRALAAQRLYLSAYSGAIFHRFRSSEFGLLRAKIAFAIFGPPISEDAEDYVYHSCLLDQYSTVQQVKCHSFQR